MRSPGRKPEKSAPPAAAEESPAKQSGKKGGNKGGGGLSKGAQDQTYLTKGQKERRRLRQMNLTELATEFRTDKHGTHFYTPHYQRYFRHLRREAITVLEIGVGGYDRYQKGGGSLRMWKWFFPQAQIIGLDIEDKSFVDEPRVRTVIGSQTDESVLHQIIEDEGAPMVVIDDGSHVPADIIATFAMLFPLLPDGAVYAIEDTQTSYWPEWGGQIDRDAEGTTMWLVRQLIDGLNHEEFLDEDYAPSYSDRHVVAVHCFHNLVIIEKGVNDEGSNKRNVLRDRFGHPDE
ncbi:hypothetical protein GCM10027020_37570 [Nocardioides salsibiostraticola]